MAQGFRRKWKNFFRIPAVKITTKVFSTIFKCILTIFLIGVITASMVGCVLVCMWSPPSTCPNPCRIWTLSA